MPNDAPTALRLWDEGNELILSLLSEVVSGRTPTKEEANEEDRHARLNRLSERLDRCLTVVLDELEINSKAPPLTLCYGYGIVDHQTRQEGLLTLLPPGRWMSPWDRSPQSEWALVRSLLARGTDGEEVLRYQREYARQGRCWLESTLAARQADLPDRPPPDEPTLFQQGNWDLREAGFATYCGVRFPLEGCNRRLLARLIRGQGRAVHSDYLIEAACLSVDRVDLKPYVSRLRRHLRSHLTNIPTDPTPYCDPHAYRLVPT
jgi:hypothetical protein